jgi:hypothetical protein
MRTPRLVAIAVLGFVLLNSPVLGLADSDALLLGVPVLYVYLFAAWALLIGLVALVTRSPD